MWFGNLVTMKWFDDVWLKEVFAGFMADKMIEPQFPEINHDLQFMLSHYPRAYSIDRSTGTHPIKQQLLNMNQAGTLYGPIIYNKAPIIFRQLEDIMQAENFRVAVQEYLLSYSHSNADWIDLAELFDKHSEKNISDWSQAWVYGKGMPHIAYEIETEVRTQEKTLKIAQMNAEEMNPFPSQLLSAGMVYASGTVQQHIWFDKPELVVSLPEAKRLPLSISLNGGGMGYGYFPTGDQNTEFLMQNIDNLSDENLRAAFFVNIHEEFLNAGLGRDVYFELLYKSLDAETNAQILNYLTNNMVILHRNFLNHENHQALISRTEELLWNKFMTVPTESKQVVLDAWLAIARSPESRDQMLGLYNKTTEVTAFRFSNQNLTTLACEIALRSENGKEILAKELQRIENPDRRKRLEFIMPAISGKQAERDSLFESLKKPENRNPEPWVLEALYYLHHPLREGHGIKYIAESLEMLEEIQRTGDIFFPKNWLDATLSSYQSAEVAELVNSYLDSHPELSESLRLKVLQSSDLLFRNNSF
jgi:aminopeptidase N